MHTNSYSGPRLLHLNSCRRKHKINSEHQTTSSIRQGPVESNSHHTMESINSASSPGLEFSKEVWVDYSKEDIVRIFIAVYEKIVYWRKNILCSQQVQLEKVISKKPHALLTTWTTNQNQ